MTLQNRLAIRSSSKGLQFDEKVKYTKEGQAFRYGNASNQECKNINKCAAEGGRESNCLLGLVNYSDCILKLLRVDWHENHSLFVCFVVFECYDVIHA